MSDGITNNFYCVLNATDSIISCILHIFNNEHAFIYYQKKYLFKKEWEREMIKKNTCKIIYIHYKTLEKKQKTTLRTSQRLILFQVVLQASTLSQQPHDRLTSLACPRWPKIRQEGSQLWQSRGLSLEGCLENVWYARRSQRELLGCAAQPL